MAADLEALTRRWFEEVWNQRRTETIDELLSPEAVIHGLDENGSDLRGPEEFRAFHATFVGAFPDMRVTLEDLVAAGDRVAVRFSASAAHQGGHLGIAPTHRRVLFTGMAFLRWQEGKLAEAWNNVDLSGIFLQVGLVRPARRDEAEE